LCTPEPTRRVCRPQFLPSRISVSALFTHIRKSKELESLVKVIVTLLNIKQLKEAILKENA
jgi:hypothetical protein